MGVFEAVVLGIVQGATEFLPVSSSGHLIVLPEIFGWENHALVFDTTLHLGTSLAVLIYFWKDLLEIIKQPKKWWLVIFLGILPAGLIGFFFNDFLESYFRDVSYVVVFLILGSILMMVGEIVPKYLSWKKDLKKLGLLGSLKIGLFQALALLPGFSRSGSTIAGGMLTGLNRKEAAKFSFLLSIPLVWAAGFYEFIQISVSAVSLDLVPIVVGFLASFITGFLCIKFFMRFVKERSLWVFIFYRIVLAVLLLQIPTRGLTF